MLQLDIDGMLVASDGLFLIQSAGERPTILGAHPTSVRQGAHTSVFIDMSSPVETSRQPPSVNLGEGIIVENVLRRGSGLDVQLSVAHDAPLGEHPIEVDEGDRLITGASLEVRDTPKIPERNCSATGHPRSTSWGWLFGVLVFIFRRKHSG